MDKNVGKKLSAANFSGWICTTTCIVDSHAALRAVRVHLFKLIRSERWLCLWSSLIGRLLTVLKVRRWSSGGLILHFLQPHEPLSTGWQFTETGLLVAAGGVVYVSSSLLGKGYLPSLVPLHCWLLSGNLVGPLLLTPSKKGGVVARRSPGRLQTHKRLCFICGSLVVVCHLKARTDRLLYLLCQILA